MPDKSVIFRSETGELVTILAVDTGVSDKRGNTIYRLGVDTELDIGPVTLGAVTIQDNGSLTNANVGVVTSISETSDALAVQAPVLGKISDAADTAGGASTQNAKLRGLVQIFHSVWDNVLSALLFEGIGVAGTPAGGVLTIQGDVAGIAVPVHLTEDIELGEVKLLDSAGTNVAQIAAVSAIAETGSSKLAVHDPTTGISTGAAVVTDAAGTVQQYLRGLVKLFAAVLPATIGQKAMAASLPITIASDQSAIAVSGNTGHVSQTANQASQASTSSFVDVASCTIDSLSNIYLSFTIINLDVANGLTWQVLAGNQFDFSDSVIVKTPTSVLAGADDSYTANPALYRYYKPQIKDTIGGTHASAKVAGISKG